MGILNDIAMGKRDFINGDVDNLSDPGNWSDSERVYTHSKSIKEVEETTEQEDVESESFKDEA